MTAHDLDKLTWPEVKTAIDGGRDTIVMALGATEQHGLHMPLATDALLGDHMAQLLANRIDAFVAPTLRVGCSEHHVGFAGTMSISETTMHAVVADLVRSLLSGGFRRVVLLPSHGGNFAPLAAGLELLDADERAHVVAVTDLSVLFQIAELGEREHGVALADGGLHAGEWETSLLLALRPDLVKMERAEAGFTGDLQEAVASMFSGGVASISTNGAIGDPTGATREHGERYWSAVEEIIVEQVEG